jgi:flagellar basal-body rod protein FlgC
MVKLPNVNPVNEMVDMTAASRSYEANLSAFETLRSMALKALEIGR